MTQAVASSKRLFIDSSAYFALATLRDTNHTAALQIQQRIVAERARPFTTNLILGETYTLLLARLGKTLASKIIAPIRSSRAVAVERVTQDDEERAWQIIDQYADKAFSFIDATSFAVMDRLDIIYAFTFDHNFEQYGKALLMP